MTVWVQSPFDNLPAEGYRKQRYWLMSEAFAAAGHAVVYFTTDFNHGTKRRREIAPSSTSQIDVRVVPVPPYSRNVSMARVVSHIAYARRFERDAASLPRPDVVVSATPTLGAATAALRLARRFGAKFVLDIQDAWPETFCRLLPRGFSWTGKFVLAPMYFMARRLYREADVVTGVSERYRGICGRDDYRLFYHGIESSSPCAAFAGRRPAGRVRTRLVYVGNIGEGYDLETVAKAVALDRRLTLDIAGRGPREGVLRALVASMGLSERVVFHGYLGADALRGLLADSDIGVIPMRDDSWVGLPYKLGDYVAAGLPVVSSLHGECGKMIEAGRLGETYDFGDAASALAAIRALERHDNVSLPECLMAERIYPAYVEHVVGS